MHNIYFKTGIQFMLREEITLLKAGLHQNHQINKMTTNIQIQLNLNYLL